MNLSAFLQLTTYRISTRGGPSFWTYRWAACARWVSECISSWRCKGCTVVIGRVLSSNCWCKWKYHRYWLVWASAELMSDYWIAVISVLLNMREWILHFNKNVSEMDNNKYNALLQVILFIVYLRVCTLLMNERQVILNTYRYDIIH